MNTPTFLDLRTDHGLSLSQLASRTGLRVSLLSGIERGHELPDEATLIALEGVYGPAVRTAVLSALPEGLAQLHAAAPLSFPWLRTLCRLEFRVTRPGVQEWAELYEQLRKLQAYRDL